MHDCAADMPPDVKYTQISDGLMSAAGCRRRRGSSPAQMLQPCLVRWQAALGLQPQICNWPWYSQMTSQSLPPQDGLAPGCPSLTGSCCVRGRIPLAMCVVLTDQPTLHGLAARMSFIARFVLGRVAASWRHSSAITQAPHMPCQFMASLKLIVLTVEQPQLLAESGAHLANLET